MTRSRARPNRRTQTLVAPPVAAALVLALFGVASIATAGTGGIGVAVSATPPPTVVGPSPSPFPTALATPPPSLQAPHVRARAAILVNLATGQVLFAKAPDARRLEVICKLDRARGLELCRKAVKEGSVALRVKALELLPDVSENVPE